MLEPSKKQRRKGLIFLLLIIILPLGWAIFWKYTTFNAPPLPIYYPEDVDEKGDTIYHTVSNYKMADQNGDTFSLSQLDTCIYVANFFFTKCHSICPPMNRNMRFIAEKMAYAPNIHFISHTVDPESDSVPVLKEYARIRNAAKLKWHFLTASQASMYNVAINYYKLLAVEEVADSFIHSEKFVLVDKQKRIRGVYNGLGDKKETDRLLDDIQNLFYEYSKK